MAVKQLPPWSVETLQAMDNLRDRLLDAQTSLIKLLDGQIGEDLLSQGFRLRGAMFEMVGQMWASPSPLRFRFMSACREPNAEEDPLFSRIGAVARICIGHPARPWYRQEISIALPHITEVLKELELIAAQKPRPNFP